MKTSVKAPAQDNTLGGWSSVLEDCIEPSADPLVLGRAYLDSFFSVREREGETLQLFGVGGS